MIVSQLEVVEQAKSYLSQISKNGYTQVISPFFMSSAGAHMRHIIDHYLALKEGYQSGLVDYDNRRRGGNIELYPDVALSVIEDINQWLQSLTKLNKETLCATLMLSTEVSLTRKVIEVVPSSLARELVFVGSHAVHHFAMIGQIVQHQSESMLLPAGFGIAPATASYMRNN